MNIYGNSFLLSEVIGVSMVTEMPNGKTTSYSFSVYLRGGAWMMINRTINTDDHDAKDEYYGHQQKLGLHIQKKEDAPKEFFDALIKDIEAQEEKRKSAEMELIERILRKGR